MASGLKENRAPQGNGVQGDASLKTIVNPNISGVNFGKIADQANQTYDPEMAKYYAAVDLARQKFSGNEEANEKMFRKEIDRIYKDELQGTLNPDTDIRGNNVISQAIRGLNEGYDDLLSIAGNAIDKPWDVIAGGIADATGQHKAADKLRNLMDGRDVGTALDIGADIALMANPMTMPIGVAKALIQQSDNIDEAIKGRDNVTLEDLTGAQRAARGGEAALSTALSMVPGVGKAGKVLKAAKGSNIAKAIDEEGKSLKAFRGGKFEDIADEDLRNAAIQAEKLDKDIPDVAKATEKYNERIGKLKSEQDEAQRVIDDILNGKGNWDDYESALNNLYEVNKKIDAVPTKKRGKALQEAIVNMPKATARAEEASEAAQDIAKSVEGRVGRLEDIRKSPYPIAVAKTARDQSRAMGNAIKGIPATYRNMSNIEKEIVENASNRIPEGLTHIPRTRRGWRNLIKENPEELGFTEEEIGKLGRSKINALANEHAMATRDLVGRTPLTGAIKRGLQAVNDEANLANNRVLFDEEMRKYLDKLAEGEKIKGTPVEKLKNLRNMVASSLSGVGALGVQGGLAGMSTGDYDNFQQGVMATFNDIEQHPWKFLPGLFPIGAKRASMRMTPGLKGNLGSSIPFNAARGAALGNYITSQTEPDTSKATSEEEILKRLAALKAGE